MAQTFTFKVPAGKSAADMVARARREAGSRGISFQGDAKAGTFSGVAEGSYTAEGDSVSIEVAKKPVFISWGMVESALRGLFENP
jgi:hypothetical protein